MIVADSSVVANMLVDDGRVGRRANAVLDSDPEWAAPEHWTVELFSALRGLALGRKISDERAAHAVGYLLQLTVDKVPVDGLLPRMWQLRTTLTGYDAAYVALAESRGLTLITSDGRLARAATPYCRVELIA